MIPEGDCSKCGLEHARCHAHSHRDGETRPCGAFPIRGATVCKNHGGMAPQVRQRAALVVAEREAAAAAQATHPRRRAAEILIDALHRADAVAQQALAEGWPDAEALQQRASALAQVVLAKDLEGQEAQLTEDTGVLLADVVRRILGRLSLTDEQEALVPVVASEEFLATAVPDTPTVRAAVAALVGGNVPELAAEVASVVVGAWRRAVTVLELSDEERQRGTAVFVEACRAGSEVSS